MKKTTVENDISLIIDSLISLIKDENSEYKKSDYYYKNKERSSFIVYIIIFRLIVNHEDYIKNKYRAYIQKFKNNNVKPRTNISYDRELDLLLYIRKSIIEKGFDYDNTTDTIHFGTEYIEARYIIGLITLLLDETNIKENHNEICIYYTIPNKNIQKLTSPDLKQEFLEEFEFYGIRVMPSNNTDIKENNILIIKNAAVNSLKHLKNYKHGLETEESYKIFYNLLKNEVLKNGFSLQEDQMPLTELDEKKLSRITDAIDDEFCSCNLNKQVNLIENVVWKESKDITLQEQMNSSINELLDFLSLLHSNKYTNLKEITAKQNINLVSILLTLISCKFLLIYINSKDIDYSLISMDTIKPKYISTICSEEEEEYKSKVKSINSEIDNIKIQIEKEKEEKSKLNKATLGDNKYQKELERLVGSINRLSIDIGTLNSKKAYLQRESEQLKKEKNKKYKDSELYDYNRSIIKHLCNAIVGCSFYLKTNNNSALFNNIIVFEDYEKADNSFYLEASFKDIYRISNNYYINLIDDNFILPKLSKN